MAKKVVVTAWLFGIVLLFSGIGLCGTDLKPGSLLPEFTLPKPEDPAHISYLGLEGKKADFTIPDIAAKTVIIEIFSMYCPFCQKEAPRVNELYNAVEKNKDVKLMGIGVGNSPFEVAYFKTTYSIRFPLFSDPDFHIHKLLGEVRTPFFIVVENTGDKSSRIIYSQLGGFDSVESFLEKAIP